MAGSSYPASGRACRLGLAEGSAGRSGDGGGQQARPERKIDLY